MLAHDLLGSSEYFQPRQARRARPDAGQPHAAYSTGGAVAGRCWCLE